MGTKIKGFYKGFKFISQIFVVKEREMEIGYPTDVKHVAHIGWDGQSASAPSWMNEFKSASENSTLGDQRDPKCVSTWSSQDYDQPISRQRSCGVFNESQSTNLPKVPKKHKRKKTRSTTSSPRHSGSSSSSRTGRAMKAKTSLNTTVAGIEIISPNIRP